MSEPNEFPKLGINTQALIDAVEADLVFARRQRNEDFGGVNWGDLGVKEVEYRLSMLCPDDGPYCVVIVEEAAPDCKLAQWLTARLDREKFPKTHIECEW